MHRTAVDTALHLEDVLYSVLQYCDLSSLSHLARTSRFLTRPTQDVLWSRQGSLTSLIEQLPPDVVQPIAPLGSRASLNDPVEQDDNAGVPPFEGNSAETQEDPFSIINTVPLAQVDLPSPSGAAATSDIDVDPLLFPPNPALSTETPSNPADTNSETNSNTPFLPVTPNLGTTENDARATGLTQTRPPSLLQRTPTEDELAPLLRQSRRALEIIYRSHDTRAAQIFEDLVALFPLINFFNSLQRVVIYPRTAGNSYYSPTVLFGNVREIVICAVDNPYVEHLSDRPWTVAQNPLQKLERDVETICSGLLRYGSQPTNIQSLTIDSDQCTLERPLDGVEWCFLTLGTGLRFLSIPALPHLKYWSLIGQMENLEELHLGQSLHTLYIFPHPPPEPDWSPVVFAQLRTLSISDYAFDRPHALHSALQATSFPSLESVVLSLPASGPILDILGWHIESIGTNAPNLRRFHLVITRHSIVPIVSEPVILGPHIIRPLLACKSLSTLVISDGFSSPSTPVDPKILIPFLDDAFVLEMLQSWPNLTTLSIVPHESSGSAITLAGLAPFGLHAHALEKLELAIGDTNVHLVYAPAMYRVPLSLNDKSTPIPDGEGSLSRLREMNIGAPWVYDTAAASEFLRAFFPRLQKVTMPEHYERGSGRMYAWEKVIKLVLGKAEVDVGGESDVHNDVAEKQVAVVLDDDDDDDDYYNDEVWEYSSSENEEQQEEEPEEKPEAQGSFDRKRLERAMLETEDMVIE